MAYLKMTREEYSRVHGVFAAAGGNDVKGVSAVLQQSHTRTTVSGTRLDLTLVVQQSLPERHNSAENHGLSYGPQR